MIMTDLPYILEIFFGIAFLAFMVSVGFLVATTRIRPNVESSRSSKDPTDHVQTFLEEKGIL